MCPRSCLVSAVAQEPEAANILKQAVDRLNYELEEEGKKPAVISAAD